MRSLIVQKPRFFDPLRMTKGVRCSGALRLDWYSVRRGRRRQERRPRVPPAGWARETWCRWPRPGRHLDVRRLSLAPAAGIGDGIDRSEHEWHDHEGSRGVGPCTFGEICRVRLKPLTTPKLKSSCRRYRVPTPLHCLDLVTLGECRRTARSVRFATEDQSAEAASGWECSGAISGRRVSGSLEKDRRRTCSSTVRNFTPGRRRRALPWKSSEQTHRVLAQRCR
jgi:hypothetical protein